MPMMAVSSKQKEFPMAPFWVVLTFFVVGLADLPYGFYMITRLVTCLVAVWLLWQLHSAGSRATPLTWLLAAVAILYNPIAPIYLYSKLIWIVANCITLGIFWSAIQYGQKRQLQRPNPDTADSPS